MKVLPTRLPGPMVIEPRVFADERGFFLETYSRKPYSELGVDLEFVQDNHSRSVRNTIRGLHFQTGSGQAKLVRAARGRVWDVVVDIRRVDLDTPREGVASERFGEEHRDRVGFLA